jgi:hypothetical protein
VFRVYVSSTASPSHMLFAETTATAGYLGQAITVKFEPLPEPYHPAQEQPGSLVEAAVAVVAVGDLAYTTVAELRRRFWHLRSL